jgi:hypothetical protein
MSTDAIFRISVAGQMDLVDATRAITAISK